MQNKERGKILNGCSGLLIDIEKFIQSEATIIYAVIILIV